MAIPPELVERLIRLLPDTSLTKSAPMTADNNPDSIIQKAFEQNIVPTYMAPGKGVYGEKSGHVVEEGETWKSIADQYGVLPDDLIVANPHISPLALAPGSFVLIPKRYSFQDFVNGVIHPDTNMGLTYESMGDGLEGGVIGGTVKSTLNTSGSPDYNLIRSIIRSRYIDSAYGNQMAQLVSETGDRKWVKHVIENAMYTDKITNIQTTTTPPSGSTDGTLDISFQIADYNASIGSTRTFVINDSMIPKSDKFTPTFTTVAANQRAAWVANPPTFTTRLVGRYVYLDDYERQQFASEAHEFLMTENQLHTQYVGGQEQVTIDLKFNHPVKELLFFYRPDDWSDSETTLKGYYKGYWSFKNPNSRFGEGHLFKTANLILNSQNMYGDGKDPVYFSYVIPTQFHKRMDTDHNVYIIPFCLDPGSCKPTGSVNMSRLDDVKLVLTVKRHVLGRGYVD
eukprot:jgi/Mesvir1/23358/Mv21053-RA.1